ncbi:hypothetical protein TTHERM_000257251 (macronuclear) [Tetrahymena thermophila SB210]|uniref:Uncharacterized protein n=1 Tax=Tetrahymena thermophila (strain SB210) TaxID=312017 RepID=W7XIV6_TETTS|nr:hypothetical protein TTHERM_000257251 [Tetrahymena thermophila SB210]EWS73639.1 hypothetical protein TTHERM_000257251 [Tetrahymena thermophila SB210]|eukprot:XP_012653869.1 hypothetical protein TTHERM_000257251 [Tetrahymena thermophila SB210]
MFNKLEAIFIQTVIIQFLLLIKQTKRNPNKKQAIQQDRNKQSSFYQSLLLFLKIEIKILCNGLEVIKVKLQIKAYDQPRRNELIRNPLGDVYKHKILIKRERAVNTIENLQDYLNENKSIINPIMNWGSISKQIIYKLKYKLLLLIPLIIFPYEEMQSSIFLYDKFKSIEDKIEPIRILLSCLILQYQISCQIYYSSQGIQISLFSLPGNLILEIYSIIYLYLRFDGKFNLLRYLFSTKTLIKKQFQSKLLKNQANYIVH